MQIKKIFSLLMMALFLGVEVPGGTQFCLENTTAASVQYLAPKSDMAGIQSAKPTTATKIFAAFSLIATFLFSSLGVLSAAIILSGCSESSRTIGSVPGNTPPPLPNPSPNLTPPTIHGLVRSANAGFTYTILLSNVHPDTTHIVINLESPTNSSLPFPIYLDVASIRWNGNMGELDVNVSLRDQYNAEVFAFNANKNESSKLRDTSLVFVPSTYGQTLPHRIVNGLMALNGQNPDAIDISFKIDENGQPVSPNTEMVFFLTGLTENGQAFFYFRRPLSSAARLQDGTYVFYELVIPKNISFFSEYVGLALPGEDPHYTSYLSKDSSLDDFRNIVVPNGSPVPPIPVPATSNQAPQTPVITAPTTGLIGIGPNGGSTRASGSTLTATVNPATLGNATHLVLFSQAIISSTNSTRYIHLQPVFVDVNSLRSISSTEAEADFFIVSKANHVRLQIAAFDENTQTFSLPTAEENINVNTFTMSSLLFSPKDLEAIQAIPSDNHLEIRLNPLNGQTSLPPDMDVIIDLQEQINGRHFQFRRPVNSGTPIGNGQLRYDVSLPPGNSHREFQIEVYLGRPGMQENYSGSRAKMVPIQTSAVIPAPSNRTRLFAVMDSPNGNRITRLIQFASLVFAALLGMGKSALASEAVNHYRPSWSKLQNTELRISNRTPHFQIEMAL